MLRSFSVVSTDAAERIVDAILPKWCENPIKRKERDFKYENLAMQREISANRSIIYLFQLFFLR